mmetsp:Transcript_44991/g.108799  ORF Transcript_44991/g.108799 Transcript_44991/m.108799 type:complete len:220 (-) Transcript_44991:1032-1691(-)
MEQVLEHVSFLRREFEFRLSCFLQWSDSSSISHGLDDFLGSTDNVWVQSRSFRTDETSRGLGYSVLKLEEGHHGVIVAIGQVDCHSTCFESTSIVFDHSEGENLQKMSCTNRPATDLRQPLQCRSKNGNSRCWAGALSKFVNENQRLRCRTKKNRSHVGKVELETTLRDGTCFDGGDACTDLIGDRYDCFGARNEASKVCHVHQQSNLWVTNRVRVFAL